MLRTPDDAQISLRTVFTRERLSSKELQHHFCQIADTVSTPLCRTKLFLLIVANRLIQKRFAVLIDEAFPHDHACRLTNIAGNPATSEFFSHGGCGTRTAEEIADYRITIRTCFDNALQKFLWLLSCVINTLIRNRGRAKIDNISPDVIHCDAVHLLQIEFQALTPIL